MKEDTHTKYTLRTTALLAVAITFLGAPSHSAAAPDVLTLVVSASFDTVYGVALEVLSETEFEVKVSDKASGHVSAQHMSPFGEPNHFMDVAVKKDGDNETEIRISARKRRFAVSGGSPEKRLAEFRKLLTKKLGESVAIVEKKQ